MITPIAGRFDQGNFVCDSGHIIQKNQYRKGVLAWLSHLFSKNTVWVTVAEGSRRHTLYVSLDVVRQHVSSGEFKTSHGIGAIFARALQIETAEHRSQREAQGTQQRRDRMLKAIADNPEVDISGEFERDSQIIQTQSQALCERAIVLQTAGNEEEALRLFRRAADQGNANAQNTLGMYESGIGLMGGTRPSVAHKDDAAAIRYFRLAADQGHASAQCNLGMMFELGRGVEQQYDKAIEWYQRSADQGNDMALCNLGKMHEEGHGVPRNANEARRFFQLAAEKGNAVAQCHLGEIFQTGFGVKRDLARAVQYYELAAAQGDPRAQTHLGVMLVTGTDMPPNYDRAAQLYQSAAEAGDSMAQCNLANLYERGQGVPLDHAKAVHWYRLAANQGSAVGQCGLGRKYLQGEGVDQVDENEAARLFALAAAQNHSSAQFYLGCMRLAGAGGLQDPSEGIRLLEHAGEQGDIRALQALAAVYRKGQGGVAVDAQKAQVFAQRADQLKLRQKTS